MSIDVSAFKEGQRRVWSAGDYPDVATTIEDAARALAGAVSPTPGEELLDVATGTGNVAMLAAAAGARVTGLDLTPKLLEVARARAAREGMEVTWVEGDAEALPFAEDSFDAVTSCFGVIFAPRQRLAAAELVRVARPGARIGLTAWTPEGLNGGFFRTIAAHMPLPPPELGTQSHWGSENHVRELFAGSGATIEFERRWVTFTRESAEALVAYHERTLGPMIMAKAALEPDGRWATLRGELLELYERANEADDGGFRARAEYLLSILRIP